LNTEQALDRLRRGIALGIKEVVFSGGEVTLRGDIVALVRAAKHLGYGTVVVLTNGRRLSNPSLTYALIDNGVTRFGLSLYGHTPQIHEQVTRIRGSFAQTLEGIATIQSYPHRQVPISVNCVISPTNFRYVADIVELLVQVDVRMVQLTYVVPVGRAKGIYYKPDMPSMSQTLQFVRKAIDRFLSHYEAIARSSISVAFYPFCVLRGLEPFSSAIGQTLTYFASEAGELVPITLEISRHQLKVKRNKCSLCNFSSLCDGVWQEYVKAKGWSEFVPITEYCPEDVIPASLD